MNTNLIVPIRLNYFRKGRYYNTNLVYDHRIIHLRRQSGTFKLDDLREIWLLVLKNFRAFQLNFVNNIKMVNKEILGLR